MPYIYYKQNKLFIILFAVINPPLRKRYTNPATNPIIKNGEVKTRMNTTEANLR
jgi:hypothetical protein